MARYFLDTSALAKIYRREAGSDIVDRLFADHTSPKLISRLSVVEMASAFLLKVRTGELSAEALSLVRRRLEADLGHRRLLVAAIAEEHFRTARTLLYKHGKNQPLRTLDALQLSVAMALRKAGLVGVLVAADVALCQVAAREGFEVLNPEAPLRLSI